MPMKFGQSFAELSFGIGGSRGPWEAASVLAWNALSSCRCRRSASRCSMRSRRSASNLSARSLTSVVTSLPPAKEDTSPAGRPAATALDAAVAKGGCRAVWKEPALDAPDGDVERWCRWHVVSAVPSAPAGTDAPMRGSAWSEGPAAVPTVACTVAEGRRAG